MCEVAGFGIPVLLTAVLTAFRRRERSFLLANFTAEEVATLYEQQTAETGQVFTAEVKAGAWELTRASLGWSMRWAIR